MQTKQIIKNLLTRSILVDRIRKVLDVQMAEFASVPYFQNLRFDFLVELEFDMHPDKVRAIAALDAATTKKYFLAWAKGQQQKAA